MKTAQSARKNTTWGLDGRYDETFGYDKNGNILSLTRNGIVANAVTLIDQLTYTNYTGNQVTKIEDAATGNGFANGVNNTTEYLYDANGNMYKDDNKGIVISYNLLNLPQTITSSTGTTMATYIYDATGRKLKKTSATGTSYYFDGLQFQKDANSNEQQYFASTIEGRVVKNAGIWNKYEYTYKDHLGNTRLSFDAGGTGGTVEIIQEDAFYAYGMSLVDANMGFVLTDKNSYLYNDKEQQDETGWYDYGARMFDPVAGRWWSIDPLADVSRRWSPYQYGYDNPIRFVDVDGMIPEIGVGEWFTNFNENEETTPPNEANKSSGSTKPSIGLSGTLKSPKPLGSQTNDSDKKEGEKGVGEGVVDGLITIINPMTYVEAAKSTWDLMRAYDEDPKNIAKIAKAQAAELGGYGTYEWTKLGVQSIPLLLLLRRVPATKGGVLNPNEIHFMQSSIKNATGEFTVLGNAEALSSGSLNPNVLRMNVWKDVSGKVWTLDNRRLAAFRLSGLQEAPIQWADPSGQMWKMTTTNGGTSIRLKLGVGQSMIVK